MYSQSSKLTFNFPFPAALWHHIYEFHLLCKPYVCSDCPVARLSSEELVKHCNLKNHQPDVLSEFKILRKVFFGKEIKVASVKVRSTRRRVFFSIFSVGFLFLKRRIFIVAPQDPSAEVITLSDSPLKPALKPPPNSSSLPGGSQTPLPSVPTTASPGGKVKS